MKSILWFTCSICLMLSTHVYSNAAETSINNSCSSCHTDFKKQLGKKHPNVNAGTIADCMACHGKSASTESFTLKIHGPHVSSQSSVKCTLCHEIVPDERFSVTGSSKNMGKPTADDVELVKNVMNDTVNGKFMAAGHNRNGVSCASCHGASLPVKGDTVANDKCLACHVSYEALAEKTKPKGAHGANPHKSHLGKIDCTVCHFGHQKSVVYCKDCHSKFNPKIPFGNSAWNYIETPYMELPPYRIKGNVNVVIGTLDDQIQPWVGSGLAKSFSGDLSNDINGDGGINPADAKLSTPEVKNTEIGPVFSVNMDKMIEYLATNPDGLGAGSSRPDIFKSGAYSPFDLLRYLVGTRADMRWEGGVQSILKPSDSKYDTYEYKISWDMNGDGKFDQEDGQYFDSSNWHFALKQSLGQNKQYAGARLAVQYSRMDQYWLREGQSYRFTVYSDEMINRIHWVWEQEQQRLADNEGKFIIPFIYHFDLGASFSNRSNPPPKVLATNLEVTAHNMRSDVFQDGVLSVMDVWLSLAEQTGEEIRFAWWPIMSSGAIANGFTLSSTPWTGNYGGWYAGLPFQGELAANSDFSGVIPTCNFNKDGSTTFNIDGTIGTAEDPVDSETCIKEWTSYNSIGGNQVNNLVGNTIMSYPYQSVGLGSIHAESVRNGTEIDLQKDHKVEMYLGADELQHTVKTLGVKGNQSIFPTEDVTGTVLLRRMVAATEETKVGNATILDKSHFGWKIADCTQCHKDTIDNKLGHGGQPWPTNSIDGFDYMQPYYCATCHGSNGAPKGHNRAARCFWCHNTNNKEGPERLWMDKHADASLPKFVPASKNVANQLTRATVPVNKKGEWNLYEDIWFPSHNSDYTMSKTFPDPYSCGTCHGFEHPLEVKKNKKSKSNVTL